jgi:hypothetical protein
MKRSERDYGGSNSVHRGLMNEYQPVLKAPWNLPSTRSALF